MSDNNPKSYGPSRSFEVLKLSKLINSYILKKDDGARVELLNKVIDGYELAEALCYLKFEITDNYEQKVEKNKKENSKVNELLNNLEGIIKGKEGTIIKEIKEIITEYK